MLPRRLGCLVPRRRYYIVPSFLPASFPSARTTFPLEPAEHLRLVLPLSGSLISSFGGSVSTDSREGFPSRFDLGSRQHRTSLLAPAAQSDLPGLHETAVRRFAWGL